MSDNFDDFKRKNSISKQAKDEMFRRAMPEQFVEKELKAFENYTQSQKEYRGLTETYLERERERRLENILTGLNSAKKSDLAETQFHRIVRSRFSHNPLCSVGSVERPPGGRFNFGKSTRFVTNYFYCLYVGDSYETSFEESFYSTEESIGDFASFKIDVKIDSFLDLTTDAPYEAFYEVIKDIRLPADFEKFALARGIQPMSLVNSPQALKLAIMSPNWKSWDTWLDLFAPSQWFGYYAQLAGIGGILYPSARRDGGKNLAIFMDNFEATGSEVALSNPNEWPLINEALKKINSDNYKSFCKIL